MKRKIVNDGSDRSANHRGDFSTCPSCGYYDDAKFWEDAATTLILNPYCDKSGHVAVMSACPRCFEESWVHVSMGRWEYCHEKWPKKWREAVDKLEDTVKLQAIRDVAFGLCGRCEKLESMTVGCSAYRTCEIGMGPVITECEKFSSVKPP